MSESNFSVKLEPLCEINELETEEAAMQVQSNGNADEYSDGNFSECGSNESTMYSQEMPEDSKSFIIRAGNLDLFDDSISNDLLKNESESNGDWKCHLCPKDYGTERGLKNHISRSHRDKVEPAFRCDICGSAQSTRGSLRKHLHRVHKEELTLRPELLTKKCDHCSSSFTTHNQLFDHIHETHPAELGMYHGCPLCNALLKSKVSYNRHVTRTHPAQKEKHLIRNPCNLCDKTFNDYILLRRHKRDDHPGPTYNCDQCSKTFKKEDSFQQHKEKHLARMKERLSKKDIQYVCKICGNKYSFESNLVNHVRNTHGEGNKVYECQICGHKSKSSAEKRIHYRSTHLRDKMKKRCITCKQHFDSIEECREHKKTHNYCCNICKKVFNSDEALKEHSRIHVEPRHECPICLRKFVQSSNMKRHVRIHTGERPFKCTHCDRRFSDKSACKSHILVHGGAQKHECEYCGLVFTQKQRLRYHVRSHTGKGIIPCCLCSKIFTNSHPLRKHLDSHALRLTRILKNMGFCAMLEEKPRYVSDVLGMMLDEDVQNYLVTNKKGAYLKIYNNDVHHKYVVAHSFEVEHGIELPMEAFHLGKVREILSSLDLKEKLDTHQKFGSFLRNLFKIPDFTKYEARSTSTTKTESLGKERPRKKKADKLVEKCLEVVINTEALACYDSDQSEEIGAIDVPPDLDDSQLPRRN